MPSKMLKARKGAKKADPLDERFGPKSKTKKKTPRGGGRIRSY